MWKANRDSNWSINFTTRSGVRRGANLVDPYSAVFKNVAANFQHFELERHLTVIQPCVYKNLTVDLMRLELTFTVNENGLLESPQLKSKIDQTKMPVLGTAWTASSS